jgi:glycosyltransferase involved in cell wall biosynthesis
MNFASLPTGGLDLACGRGVVVVSHGFGSNYERGFCNALAENGVAVTLVSSDRTDYASLLPAVIAVNLRGSQEETRCRILKVANIVLYHLRLLAFTLRKSNAVVHVIGLTQPPLLCGVIEGLWFRLFAKQYVLTIHDLLPHDRHTFRMRIMHWLTYQLPDRLVVHTRRMANELEQQFHVSPDRIVIMEHGIEPLATMPVFPAPSSSDNLLRLIFFGFILPYKGVDLLLDAIAGLKCPVFLTIAGRCNDTSLTQELKTRIAASPYAESITWRNEFIPEHEIEPLFINADALVLPYRHIDQSGVLFQALRFGLPVIATCVGEFEHYISHDVGEICAPENTDDLCAALKRYAARKNRMSRQKIVEIGRSYEWPKTVRSLAVAYGVNRRGCR